VDASKIDQEVDFALDFLRRKKSWCKENYRVPKVLEVKLGEIERVEKLIILMQKLLHAYNNIIRRS